MTEKASRQDTLNYKVEPKNSFGASLRRERELRSVPLEDVSKATNIQLAYLQALEEDDYDKLPHSTFVRGFIRSYARYIGLNPDNVIANYDHFMTSLVEETVERPIEYQNKKNNWFLTVVISCALFILALLGYYLVVSMQAFKEKTPLTTETQPISPSTNNIQPGSPKSIKDTLDRESNSKVQPPAPSILPSNPDIQLRDLESAKESVDAKDNPEIQPTAPSNPGMQPRDSGSVKESVDAEDNPEIQPAPPSNPGMQSRDSGSVKESVDAEDNPEIQPAPPPRLGDQPKDPRPIKEPIEKKDSSEVQPENHKVDTEPNDKEGITLPPAFSPNL